MVGTALAGRAADELRSRAGIESYTIHGLLQDLDRGGDYGFSRGAVLVVDEAGMVGTRKCDRLIAHAAAADAKVVLVGDERQLAAIEAGGAVAALADRLGASELCEVHRQAHVWDREALDQLRHGDISRWVEAYRDHGRLVAFNDADDQLRALVEDWYVAAHSDGMDETLMLAVRRHEVERSTSSRVGCGSLPQSSTTPPPWPSARAFAIDDRVLATRNTHVERADGGGRIPVRNGNAGSARVDHIAGKLGVRLDSGVEVTLPSAYLDEGHLMRGYARTIHKSQGSTAKRTFVLGSPDLARRAWLCRRVAPHRPDPLLPQRRRRSRPRPAAGARRRGQPALRGARAHTRPRARKGARVRSDRGRRRPRDAADDRAPRDHRPRAPGAEDGSRPGPPRQGRGAARARRCRGRGERAPPRDRA